VARDRARHRWGRKWTRLWRRPWRRWQLHSGSERWQRGIRDTTHNQVGQTTTVVETGHQCRQTEQLPDGLRNAQVRARATIDACFDVTAEHRERHARAKRALDAVWSGLHVRCRDVIVVAERGELARPSVCREARNGHDVRRTFQLSVEVQRVRRTSCMRAPDHAVITRLPQHWTACPRGARSAREVDCATLLARVGACKS
jgi:hypothetical protein